MKARDVAIGPGGEAHFASVEVASRTIVFDNEKSVTVPDAVITVRLAVDGRGVRYAVAPTHEHPYAYVVSEHGVLFTVPHGGRFMAAIRGVNVGAEVYGQGTNEDGLHTTITVYATEPGGSIVRTFQALYGSMGILGILGTNEILSSADPSTIRQVSGVQGWSVNTLINGWSIMQTEDQPPYAGLRVTAPGGEQYQILATPQWNGYTNMPSYLAIANSGPIVAINDPDGAQQAPDPAGVQLVPVGGAPDNPGALVSLMQPSGAIVPASSSLANAINAALTADHITAIGVVVVVGAAALLLIDE